MTNVIIDDLKINGNYCDSLGGSHITYPYALRIAASIVRACIFLYQKFLSQLIYI